MSKFPKETSARDLTIGLNSIATRCFRNTADHEYIVARMSYRAHLLLQFNWSALHALEKHLKAICLYNRIDSRECGHDLKKLRDKLDRLDFFVLSDETSKFMDKLQDNGGDRYLAKSWMSEPLDLPRLDRAVWEVRRFCRVLNPEFTRDPEGQREPLARLRSEILRDGIQPHDEPPLNGRLEEILAMREHPARKPLIWMNYCFGPRRRKTVKIRGSVLPDFENSPSFLYPEIVEEAKKYVFWPKDRSEK